MDNNLYQQATFCRLSNVVKHVDCNLLREEETTRGSFPIIVDTKSRLNRIF